MNRTWLKSTIAALLLFASDQASAQTPSDAIDSAMPPAGYVAPKPAAERDLSMATYAKESFLDGEEGVVGLRVLVRKNGSVAEAQVATSSGTPRLDQYAQATVKDWRYVPANVNGTPVDTWIRVNVIWALQTLRFELDPNFGSRIGAYYPPASLRGGETGITVARFLVLPNGTVGKVLIDRPSGHPRLDDATVKLITSGMRFGPAMLTSGETVGAWYRISWYWGLKGSTPKDDGPCFTEPNAANPDRIIAACTEFLAGTGVTAYQRALALGARATAHFSKHAFDPAITDFDAAIQTSPGMAQFFVGRALTEIGKGQRDLAFADFDSAIQVEPLNYETYLGRAQAYFDAGQLDRSLTDFQRAMRMTKANNPGLLASRCRFLAHIGRPQDGLADCDKALGLVANVPASLGETEAMLEIRGYAYFKLGQYQKAIQDYDAAIKRNGRLASALYARGVAKLKSGDAKGDVDITAAKAINPYIANMAAEDGIAP
jgi:TonB family protein